MSTESSARTKTMREPFLVDALISLLFIILIVSISLAVLLGTLIISPNKFVPLTELSRRNQDRQG